MNRDTPFPGATVVVDSAAMEWVPFPIPGATGELSAVILNQDATLGPAIFVLRMAPGARIPAHYHERAKETFVVTSGDFVNAGVSYGPGAFFGILPGDVHGPHETVGGCEITIVQTEQVDPSDFFIAE